MKEEIRNELREMGSSLAGSRVGMPYEVGVGYFDHFTKELNAAIAGEEVVGVKLPDTVLPYGMPDGYFESLPGRLLQRVEEQRPSGILITFGQLRVAAAAVLLLAVGLGSYEMAYRNKGAVKKDVWLANVADKEIQEYLSYNYSDHGRKAESENLIGAMDIDARDIISYLDETGWDISQSF